MNLLWKMSQFADKLKKLNSAKSISRYATSFCSVLITQFSLALVPHFFFIHSLFTQFILAAVVLVLVMVFGRKCRKLVGVRASAAAFVLFNILFIWGFYVAVVRTAASPFMDVAFNLEVIMLVVGHCSIMASDPGLTTDGHCSEKVADGTEQNVEAVCEMSLPDRARYCSSCKGYIRGFDHHCPAFGNCIGQNNRVLFILLLIGFLISEESYIFCSYQFLTRFQVFDGTQLETSLCADMVLSTMLFSVFQVIWQGIFLIWHSYCICFNIRTDEWINWRNYPEFQVQGQSQPGQTHGNIRFKNPYDKGIAQNVKEFLARN